MPQRYGISFFRPEVRSAVATGMQARGAMAIGRLEIRERTDSDRSA
jgi:hypothetical protein